MYIYCIRPYTARCVKSICVFGVYYRPFLRVFTHQNSSEFSHINKQKPHCCAVFLMRRLMRHYYGDTVVVSETIENTRPDGHCVYFVCIFREVLFVLTRSYSREKIRQQTGSVLFSMKSGVKTIDIFSKFQLQKYGVLYIRKYTQKKRGPHNGDPLRIGINLWWRVSDRAHPHTGAHPGTPWCCHRSRNAS